MLAREGVKVVKAVAPWISVEQLGLRQALSNHPLGDLGVIGSCLLLFFTLQADGLMIIDR